MTQKICFVIAPIGEAGSDIRKRSDQVLKHVIAPAVETCGYDALRADQISEPGMITSQVIQHIVDDPLVVADLTGWNPNVFYELAIRHALRKPLVQMIKRGEQIPFDVAGTRTVYVDHKDLDSVEEAKAEIEKQVKALEKDPSNIETPISVSLDLQLLRQSENPEQRSLGDLLAVITELRSGLSSLEKRLDNPEAIIPPAYVRDLVRAASSRRRVHPKMLMEMREILSRISESSMSAGTKENLETRELLSRLEHMLVLLMHEMDEL
jgi:hypothetical protein